MPKVPYETISILLDYSDIEYLSNLLYTVEITKELRDRLIPQSVYPSQRSNFVRVEHKINTLLRWFSGKAQTKAIAKPLNPLCRSRLKPHPKKRKSKPRISEPL